MKQEAPPSADAIVIRGAHQNNLKNLTLSIPPAIASDQTNPVPIPKNFSEKEILALLEQMFVRLLARFRAERIVP